MEAVSSSSKKLKPSPLAVPPALAGRRQSPECRAARACIHLRGWTQTSVAGDLDEDPATLSLLLNGRLRGTQAVDLWRRLWILLASSEARG